MNRKTRNCLPYFKNSLFILLIFFLSSCSISSTYSYKDVDKVIKDICREEFAIDVSVWIAGDSVWIYAPFKKLINEKGQWDEKTSEDIRRIFLSLSRVFLSLDKMPKFYTFVASSIENIGADVYIVGFVPDMIKFQMGLISLKEREERVAFFSFENPQALGDATGKHIQASEIALGEFISYLAKQSMEKRFTAPPVKEDFAVNSVQTYYQKGKLGMNFNITALKYKEGMLRPFEEAKKIIKKFLDIYGHPREIVEIEITDSSSNKTIIYTQKSLLSD